MPVLQRIPVTASLFCWRRKRIVNQVIQKKCSLIAARGMRFWGPGAKQQKWSIPWSMMSPYDETYFSLLVAKKFRNIWIRTSIVSLPCFAWKKYHLLVDIVVASTDHGSDSTQTIDHIQKCFRQKFQCSRRPSYWTALFFYRWRHWSYVKVNSTFLNGTIYFFSITLLPILRRTQRIATQGHSSRRKYENSWKIETYRNNHFQRIQ